MKVNNIKKIVDGRSIIDNITIDFGVKGMIFIVGKSGAGKSSLLNIISGTDCEYEGCIVTGKNKLEKEYEDAYRQKYVATIYQDFNLINHLTVGENIVLGRRIAGLDDDKLLMGRIVEKLEITSIIDRSVVALSGGERQRVAIARALYRENNVICADEPTGNLDHLNSENLFELLKDISKDKLCIVVSHDMEAAQKYADRIIEISDGKVIKDNENKIAFENDKNSTFDYNYLKKKWIPAYSRNSFSKRIKKQTGVIASMIISMICLFLVLGFVTSADDMVNEIDSTYLENDKYIIKNIDNPNSSTNALICLLQKQKEVKKIVSYCSFSLSTGDGASECDVNIITEDDFFQERYADINGELPGYKQIMVSDNFAIKYFNKTDICGEKIELCTNMGRTYEFEISGVKESASVDNYELYLSKETHDMIVKDVLDEGIDIGVGGDEAIYFMGKNIEEADESKLIVGRMPEKEDEILINVNSINSILENLNQNNIVMPKEDIIDSISDFEFIFSLDLKIGHDMFIPQIDGFKVVGIIDDCGKYEWEMNYAYYDSDYILSKVCGNTIMVYVDNLKTDFAEKLKNEVEEGVTINNYAKFRSNSIRTRILSISVIVAIIAIIIIIVSAVVIHYFMKISIVQRQYEISVLRGMGCKKEHIASMLMIEQSYIALIVIFVSIAVVVICDRLGFFNKFMIDMISIYKFKMWHIGVVSITAIVAIFLFSIIDIIRASKMNIVDGMREKYKI